MKMKFIDIPDGLYKAKVSEIKKGKSRYGPYLRITFTIIEDGEISNYKFSGIVKPIHIKQSKFFRWVTNILGTEPGAAFSTNDLLEKQCLIHLVKNGKYYTVTDVSPKPNP
jgi:hypothetical protein